MTLVTWWTFVPSWNRVLTLGLQQWAAVSTVFLPTTVAVQIDLATPPLASISSRPTLGWPVSNTPSVMG